MRSLVKIFCVAKDESDLIESWLTYHGKLVGFENLVVIDNGSTCTTVLGVYDKYKKQGVKIDTCTSFSGCAQGEAFTAAMKKQQKFCKFLIGIDADEFITFPDFLCGKRGADHVAKLREYLLGLPDDTTKLEISTYFESVPDPNNNFYVDHKIENPVQNISTFRRCTPRATKYFFRSGAFVSTVNGCHNGRVSHGKTRPSTLCVVHYHSTGGRRSIERARAIISAYGYANVDATPDTQLRQLMRVTSPFGSHRVREYGVFLSKLSVLRDLVKKQLWPSSQGVLAAKALRFHTINRVDVDTTHCTRLPCDWEEKFDSLVFLDKCDEHALSTRPLLDPPSRDTRVALMLSGHFRNFAARKAFWKRFVDEHQHRQVDIFVHTWSENGDRVKGSWIDVGHGSIDVDDIRNTINPVSMQVQNHAEVVDQFSLQQEGLDLFYVEFPGLVETDDFSKHVVSQLYSVHKAFELVAAHEKTHGIKYDLLVRQRADSVVENFSRIFSGSLDFVRDDVLVVNGSSNHRHPGGGGGCSLCDQQHTTARKHAEHANDVCDVFYWGNFSAMKKACELFLHAHDLVQSFKFYNARAVTEAGVKSSLVPHKKVTGVKKWSVYEKRIKCFYPERLLREHMVSHWIISDPLRMTPKILY